MDDTSLNAALSRTFRLELANRRIPAAVFAKSIGLPQSTVQRLHEGSAPWKASYMQAVARGFGWSIADLIEHADPNGELTDFTQRTATKDDYAPAAFETDVEPDQDWDSRYDSA